MNFGCLPQQRSASRPYEPLVELFGSLKQIGVIVVVLRGCMFERRDAAGHWLQVKGTISRVPDIGRDHLQFISMPRPSTTTFPH
jgi:hypothetical protein